MTQKQLVPKRRFEGFMGDWKEIKLGEVAEFNPNSTLPDVFKYVDLESVIGTEIVSYRTEFKRSAPSRAQRLAVSGDIFYQTVRPYQKNNYLYDLPYNNFVFSTGYAQMRPDINGYFLLSLIQEEKFVMKVLNRCTGTGYPAINSNDLANIEIRVPNDRKEQQKIGQFFKHLDEMIALQQRKLDNTKALKSAYLAEMFPVEGERVPKRRFAGFTEEWKKFRLDDIAIYRRGSFPQPYGKEYWYDETDGQPFVQVVDVGKNFKLVDNTKQKISKLAQQYSVFVEEGKVLVTLQGSIGRVAITQYPSYVDRTILIFENYKLDVNKEYFAYVVQMLFEIEKLKAPGGTIKTITKEALSEFLIHLPDIKEQQKIGQFFKHLDEMIATHQQKLEKLKATKQAYLHEMFV